MPGIQIEIPREVIEQIAREACESMLAESRATIHDEQAEELERKLQRINAKQFITIPEFALLFNCSTGHVGKLLDQAQDPKCQHPIPYLDLNGLIQFDRLEVLQWARTRKPLQKRQRKTGGKKNHHLKAVNQ